MVEELEEVEPAQKAIATGAIGGTAAPKAPAAPTPATSAAAPASTAAPVVKPSVPMESIKMPALSPTMTEGGLATWEKKIGDRIMPGEVLAQVAPLLLLAAAFASAVYAVCLWLPDRDR